MKKSTIASILAIAASLIAVVGFIQLGEKKVENSNVPPLQIENRAISIEQTAEGDKPETELPYPTGKVILTVTGALKNTNSEGKALFDREMLLSFGIHKLRTTTTWTDGVQVFEGILASDIMDAVGANGTYVVATALNDYVVDIPISDFEKYGVLFALKMNGKTLTTRDKGPIWPVYPRDDYPELQNRAADKKWCYLIYKMEIK